MGPTGGKNVNRKARKQKERGPRGPVFVVAAPFAAPVNYCTYDCKAAPQARDFPTDKVLQRFKSVLRSPDEPL